MLIDHCKNKNSEKFINKEQFYMCVDAKDREAQVSIVVYIRGTYRTPTFRTVPTN